MKVVNSFFLFLVFLWIPNTIKAQDSIKLSANELIAIVKKYHPLSYKYQLNVAIADKEIQKSRGNFDPILAAKLGEKNIDQTQYYNQKNAEISIPTWYGIDLNAGYNHLSGDKLLNNETKGGLYQLGINIPLAKNLLYDKRRAMLEQANYAKQMTEAEQITLNNELLLEAENTYWNWVQSFELYQLQKNMVKINKERLELTKKALQYGERPAIDTVEVFSQLQNYQLKEKDAYLGFLNETQNLQLFLWKENEELKELNQDIYPSSTLLEHPSYTEHPFLLEKIDQFSIDQNAYMNYYFQKSRILESERKLKWQSFLPKIDFSYNFYSKENYPVTFLPFFENNFSYGIKLEIPIFQRQARADYQIAKLKIEQNNREIDLKKREITTKVQIYKNDILGYFSQLELSESTIQNYKKLLWAEQTKYNNGESSLFLINSRENKWIEANEKMIVLRNKFLKSYNKLKWWIENYQK